MSDFFTILTNIGQAKIAAATTGGNQVALTHMAVGSGLDDAYYTPVESQLTLKTEVWRGALNDLRVDNDNANWIVAEVVVPASSGGFMIREAALFDTAGDMIAIGKFPETYKPTISSGSGKDILIKFVMQVSNTAAVTLQIDPSIILAPRSYVDAEILEAMTAHQLESNPHPGYATDQDLADHINDTNDPHEAAGYVKESELQGLLNVEAVPQALSVITLSSPVVANTNINVGFDYIADGLFLEVYRNSGRMSIGAIEDYVEVVGNPMNESRYVQFNYDLPTGTKLIFAISGLVNLEGIYATVTYVHSILQDEATLTDQATVAWDWSTQAEAKITLGGSRSLAAPSNLASNRYAALRVVQDATGGRTLAFASNYKGVADLALSSEPNAVDWLLFRNVNGTNCELVGYRNNVGA